MSATGFWIALHTNYATDKGIPQIDMLSALVDMITVTKRSLAFSFSHSLLRVRSGLGIIPHVVLCECEWEVVDSLAMVVAHLG